MNELKVFIELMPSNAEMNGMDTILAKNLFEACSAYASLIYEFNLSDDFFKFIQLAEIVCSYLTTDKKIAEKLLAVKDKVPYLDEIQKSKGNAAIFIAII